MLSAILLVLLAVLAAGFGNSYTFGSLIALVAIVTAGRVVLDLLKGSGPRDLT